MAYRGAVFGGFSIDYFLFLLMVRKFCKKLAKSSSGEAHSSSHTYIPARKSERSAGTHFHPAIIAQRIVRNDKDDLGCDSDHDVFEASACPDVRVFARNTAASIVAHHSRQKGKR